MGFYTMSIVGSIMLLLVGNLFCYVVNNVIVYIIVNLILGWLLVTNIKIATEEGAKRDKVNEELNDLKNYVNNNKKLYDDAINILNGYLKNGININTISDINERNDLFSMDNFINQYNKKTVRIKKLEEEIEIRKKEDKEKMITGTILGVIVGLGIIGATSKKKDDK